MAPFRGSRNDLLPRDARAGLIAGGMTLRPPTSASAGTPGDGFVDYGTTTAAYGVLAATDGPGRERVGFVVGNRDLARFRVPVELPAGVTVDNEDSGEVTVHTARGLDHPRPAIAVDAVGHPVPARYRPARPPSGTDAPGTEPPAGSRR